MLHNRTTASTILSIIFNVTKYNVTAAVGFTVLNRIFPEPTNHWLCTPLKLNTIAVMTLIAYPTLWFVGKLWPLWLMGTSLWDAIHGTATPQHQHWIQNRILESFGIT
ncbi:hypothetical protein BU26DRAFT_515824 [Trematosphaeria pertusa]|uniref:Uncharacterized protein n=1 Tax=Trematosphaeria pertusa TaxID=390896 RepID=A0A6A6ISJ9_9PLEO|nr:uncharacterized protein BU26DRAFT_515824 [Trematosphaeria pertusa]KAF2253471.1 hypothetical protein BU26DRAFT_515824 [Trematosphaeria pertusa]